MCECDEGSRASEPLGILDETDEGMCILIRGLGVRMSFVGGRVWGWAVPVRPSGDIREDALVIRARHAVFAAGGPRQGGKPT